MPLSESEKWKIIQTDNNSIPGSVRLKKQYKKMHNNIIRDTTEYDCVESLNQLISIFSTANPPLLFGVHYSSSELEK